MKLLSFSLLALLASSTAFSQNTFIPDDQFEQELINLGLDNLIDDSVATANIDTLTDLHITWKEIDNLTGIEDFSSLEYLNVGFNNLTTLNLSQNTNLQHLFCELNDLNNLILGNNINLQNLYCRGNQLTQIDLSGLPALDGLSIENNLLQQLDLSQNPLLDWANVHGNPLKNLDTHFNPVLKALICNGTPVTALDLSQNPLLFNLDCSETQLTELDLSQNPGIFFLNCSTIPTLQSLNLKNGSNTELLSFNAVENPNLFCIEVDSPAYSQQNWINVDSWASFQEVCLLHLEEFTNAFHFHPNPAVEQIVFSIPVGNSTIRDLSGRVVKKINEFTQSVPVSELPQGIYTLQGTNENGESISIRFIKQEF